MRIRYRLTVLLTALSVLTAMLCGCGKDGEAEVTGPNTPAAGENGSNNTAAETAPAESFSEYCFSFTGVKENYMVILRRGERPCDISVTLENNRYESRDFVITAPDGYEPRLPAEQDYAYSAVNLITNDIDDTPVPDIMQFTFDMTSDELERNGEDDPLYTVYRMYTVDAGGELRLITVADTADPDGDGETEEVTRDFLDRTQLYHSEPDKFIYEISVDDRSLYEEDGTPRPIWSRVRIKTLTFEYNVPRLLAGYEEITEEKPLYFGYACWGAANSAAQYFTMTPFNISDWENYIEMPAGDGAYDYYFVIDDPRFANTFDLKKYLRSIFTQPTADALFADAPQRYRNINGKLCGMAGDGGYDTSLGMLTFSGMSITENRMIFRSRQEKFDDTGRFTGYTDGGNFIIDKGEDGMWKVSAYRYPYSLN